MRMKLLFAVLICAVVGLGVGAIVKDVRLTRAAAEPAGTLAASHASKGVACGQCHETPNPQPVAMLKCVTCHDTKATAARTAKVTPNPHDNRHFGTEADCNSCHHQHKMSENLCVNCHPRGFNFKVP